MDKGRWQEIERLFLEASELAPDECRKFLDQACGSDDDLKAEVLSLLEAGGEAEQRISDAVADALELVIEDGGERQTVGSYRVVRKIGEGGLSTVYLAQRAAPYRMSVAVKVVKRGMDTADILRRLQQERQILASLKHANIAQLLDGGTTEDGLPYFVMEHIEGEHIDAYCDRHTLDVRQRLMLFRVACSAVHHAHQNLIIHRDIKPSNLLVTDDGVPKLLDFGIAKLLDPSVGNLTVAPTVTGLRLLTPDYASPEQVQGRPLTTATDVYSLGVMLYRLLTNRQPYSFDTRSPQEIERVVCGVEPEKPSLAVGRAEYSDPALATRRRQLTGDLDNIVLMALRKEQGRRYASVEQLSEDIDRYLRDQPVIARKDTLTYRADKFFRRHRRSVLAAGLLLLSLLIGIIATTRATLNANAQRQRAEHHLAEAQQITRFLVDLFETSNLGSARSREITAYELLEQGTRRIAGALQDQPELRANLMSTLGRVHQNLALYDQARELLQQSLELRRQTLGEQHAQVAVGLTELAGVLFEEADFDTAELMLRQALAIQRPKYPEGHQDLANTLELEALMSRHVGQGERAEQLYREALTMHQRWTGEDSLATARTLRRLGELLYEGAPAEAQKILQKSLELHRAKLGDEHPDVATVLTDLAAVHWARRDSERAEELTREVLEVRRRLLGESHPSLAVTYNNLAALLEDQGKYEEAETWVRQALSVSVPALGESHPDILHFQHSLARNLDIQGHDDEAEQLYSDILQRRRDILGPDHVDVTRTMSGLASFLAVRDRRGEARELLEEVIEIQGRTLPQDDFLHSYPMIQLGTLLAEQGDCAAALPWLRRVVELRQSRTADDPDRLRGEQALAQCLDQ